MNAEGWFDFLETERHLGEPPDWIQGEASRLWRYHLHYFEWAMAFLAHPDREWARRSFAELWRSWHAATRFGRGDAWSPYVASLRAWVLCALYEPLVAGSSIADRFVADLAQHAGFIRVHVELDVGGNHLIKNLKALVGLGLFLHDDSLLRSGVGHLESQLKVQVLADGGHFERSPLYHCQVLGDLMDARDLLDLSGGPLVPRLEGSIAAMQRWLGAMLMPDGDVPLFNDCTLVGRQRLELLKPTPPQSRLVVLPESGYVIASPSQRIHLVADVGPPCPPDLPAHAHADCLSFELAVDGRRVVVDTGTSTYESGARRDHERSTRAHNTVEIDGADQTEVWGAFRAGRRATSSLERIADAPGEVEIVASHDGYRKLSGSPRHRRTWRLRADRLEVVDVIEGAPSRHGIAAVIHLSPDQLTTDFQGPNLVRADRMVIENRGSPNTAVEIYREGEGLIGWVADQFGCCRPAQTVVLSVEGTLPLSLTAVLCFPPNSSECPLPLARVPTSRRD
jgi:uncharacterized heparinase superfamily protein